jgi:hypothetical protein
MPLTACVPDELALTIMEVHLFVKVGLDDGAPSFDIGFGPHAEDFSHELFRITLDHLGSHLLSVCAASQSSRCVRVVPLPDSLVGYHLCSESKP